MEENEFMEGSIKPVKAIEKVFKIKPSAELQQLVDDITAQFDEDSFGMTYDQLYEITTVMFGPSNDPETKWFDNQ